MATLQDDWYAVRLNLEGNKVDIAGTAQELKTEVNRLLETTNLNIKKKDFEHLLFNNKNSDIILRFKEFINEVIST